MKIESHREREIVQDTDQWSDQLELTGNDWLIVEIDIDDQHRPRDIENDDQKTVEGLNEDHHG